MILTKLTDTDLISETLANNQAAYAELIKRHQRFVFTLAMRFTKTREDAEEVAQDCFVKAYRSLGSFQQTSKFSTWLYSIVYTTAMSFLRKKRIDTESIDNEEAYLQVEAKESDYSVVTIDQKVRNKYLQQAIAMLLPDDAAIITLFYQGEQSLEEIAAEMGMEANTVKVKLHRARHRLKDKLEGLLKHEAKDLI